MLTLLKYSHGYEYYFQRFHIKKSNDDLFMKINMYFQLHRNVFLVQLVSMCVSYEVGQCPHTVCVL